jgi:hypothetical protein
MHCESGLTGVRGIGEGSDEWWCCDMRERIRK